MLNYINTTYIVRTCSVFYLFYYFVFYLSYTKCFIYNGRFYTFTSFFFYFNGTILNNFSANVFSILSIPGIRFPWNLKGKFVNSN